MAEQDIEHFEINPEQIIESLRNQLGIYRSIIALSDNTEVIRLATAGEQLCSLQIELIQAYFASMEDEISYQLLINLKRILG